MAEKWEIKKGLTDRIEELCNRFLSGGSNCGGTYRCAGINGGKGDSLVVHLVGDRRGLWYENNPNCGLRWTKGGPLTLFMLVCGIDDFAQGYNAAAKWLGLPVSNSGNYNRKQYESKPKVESVKERIFEPKKERVPYEKLEPMCETFPLNEDSEVYDYLVNVRQISPETLKLYGVRWGNFAFKVKEDNEYQWKNFDGYAFLFYSPDGNIRVGTKYFALHRTEDGGKLLRSDKGMTAEVYHLWGMQTVPEDADELFIAEGEIDAMSLRELGYNAVSVPFGAKADSDNGDNSGNRWIENDYEWLERFSKIYIVMDNDSVGKAAAETLMRRLDIYRTYRVDIPETEYGKDCNDLLRNNATVLIDAIKNASVIMPEKLKRAGDFEQQMLDDWFPPEGSFSGREMPWVLPKGSFLIRNGETTVVTGHTKNGKTTLLSFMNVFFADKYNDKIYIASLEIKAFRTLQTVWRQAMAKRSPESRTDIDFRKGMDWVNEHFFVYDAIGRVEFAEILESMKVARKRFNVRIFWIDSLMKLGIRKDDYDAQNNLMNELECFAKDYDCHVFIVCHAKKPQNKKSTKKNVPEGEDVEGSGDITKIACNTFAVHRNREKEDELRKLKFRLERAYDDGTRAEIQDEIDNKMEYAPDALWVVIYQRSGDGDCPVKQLWFDKETWQYGERLNFTPQRFV